MPLQIIVPDESTRYLNQQAVHEASDRLERYADDLLSEAGRLEAAQLAAAGDPEITSSMGVACTPIYRHL